MNDAHDPKPTGTWLLSWARKTLAPATYERTMAAAQADLEHEIRATPDPAARRRLARSGRWIFLRVLVLALFEDRRAARRGLRWWLLGAPLLAVLVGLVGLPLGHTTPAVAQLAFLAAGLLFGGLMAATPRRILEHEAVGAGWIAAALMLLPPLIGTSLAGSARWLAIGPLHLQIATLVMPFSALALTRLLARGQVAHAMGLLAATESALILSSDLASALTLAVIAIAGAALASPPRARTLVPLSLVGLLGAALAATRDPALPGALHSEGVLGLLAEVDALWVVLGLAALAIAALAPLTTFRATRDPWARALGLAVALSLLMPLVANAFLATPVPLLGYGGSAIVATYLGMGALLSLERGSRPEQAPERM